MAMPPPNLRIMQPGAPPSSTPTPLVVPRGQQPPVPRPAAGPVRLMAGPPPRAATMNVPPPVRQLTRWFLYVDLVLCVMYR